MHVSTHISNGLTPDLLRKIEKLQNRRPLMRAAAQAATKAMKEHYRGLPQNTRGFPSQGFWKKEGVDRVAIQSFDNSQATVIVDSVPMAHRFFGGTVKPKSGRALSIPLSPEAYKAGSASLFRKPLTMVCRPGKPPLLVETGRIGRSKAWKLHYVLPASVTHAPDPRAWPPKDRVKAAVYREIAVRMDMIMRVSG